MFFALFSNISTVTTTRWIVGVGNLLVFVELYAARAFIDKYNIIDIMCVKINFISVLIGYLEFG